MKRVVTVFAAAGFALMLLPLLGVLAYSLNSARGGFVFEGLTLDWYAAMWRSETIRAAATNTLLLACASAFASTVLGTMLAIGLERYPHRARVRRSLEVAVDLPVVTPDIVLAACVLVALMPLQRLSDHFLPGLPAMILGHVSFELPFVALLVRSRLEVIGPSLYEAAHDLYAGSVLTFARVTLPLIAPAVLAGALFAFVLSLDDFAIAFFTAGPGSDTLPILIYASLRRGLAPEIHALSACIFAVTFALVVAAGVLTRSERTA